MSLHASALLIVSAPKLLFSWMHLGLMISVVLLVTGLPVAHFFHLATTQATVHSCAGCQRLLTRFARRHALPIVCVQHPTDQVSTPFQAPVPADYNSLRLALV
jgi:hypothetical protein